MRRFVVDTLVLVAGFAAMLISPRAQDRTTADDAPRERPVVHHIHHNSPDPAAAIGTYLKAYPNMTKVRVMDLDGFQTANGVTFLFSKVTTRPRAAGPDRPDVPQDAFWHHVWTVPDVRQTFARISADVPGFRVIPQYLDPEGATGVFSSDGMPGFLTRAQLAEAKNKGAVPSRRNGYFNWYGPDDIPLESLQGGIAEVYSIFGMFQEQPLCAVLWYQQHLNAAPPPARGAAGIGAVADRTIATCTVERGEPSWPSTYRNGHYRIPSAVGVAFGEVIFRWYMNQGDRPLVSTRGGVVDHVALSVRNVDEWATRLRAEGVRILEAPHTLNGTRVMMIEGPSREAIELVQVSRATSP